MSTVTGPTKLLFDVLCPTLQPTLPSVNQQAVIFLGPVYLISRYKFQLLPIAVILSTSLYAAACKQFPGSWSVILSGVYRYLRMRHPESRICKHTTGKLKSSISTISEGHTTLSPAWQFSLSAWPVRFAPRVCLDPAHSILTTIELRALTGTEEVGSHLKLAAHDALFLC